MSKPSVFAIYSMGIQGKLFFYVGILIFILGVILRVLDHIMMGVILNFAGMAFIIIGLLMQD